MICKAPQRAHRSGLTLLESLIVMAIMAILSGLMLAAVQKVRAISQRIACLNNVRQVAIGCQAYHDLNRHLPHGTTSHAHEFPAITWMTFLLPHIEQSQLWDTVGPSFAVNSYPFSRSPQHPCMGQPLFVYSCPSDTRTSVAWRLPILGEINNPIALSSYMGNAGLDYQTLGGVYFYDSRTSFNQISDGMSQTILIGERPPSADLLYGWWYFGDGQDGHGNLDATIGSRELNRARHSWYRSCGVGPFEFVAGHYQNHCDALHYWSLHVAGANFAFCDGSARFLSYSANAVLPFLSTRAGNESSAID
jgi:prepilin-type N-terminal cleavage/methylation domain-containing protein/prepilin-type processing-associated H-X9-DG protein